MRYNIAMKISLQSWNAILLGPAVLALTYLSQAQSKPDPGGRAAAFGILFYLAIPVVILLIVDGIKIQQHFSKRGKIK